MARTIFVSIFLVLTMSTSGCMWTFDWVEERTYTRETYLGRTVDEGPPRDVVTSRWWIEGEELVGWLAVEPTCDIDSKVRIQKTEVTERVADRNSWWVYVGHGLFTLPMMIGGISVTVHEDDGSILWLGPVLLVSAIALIGMDIWAIVDSEDDLEVEEQTVGSGTRICGDVRPLSGEVTIAWDDGSSERVRVDGGTMRARIPSRRDPPGVTITYQDEILYRAPSSLLLSMWLMK